MSNKDIFNNFIKRTVKYEDLYKVSMGNGFEYKNAKWYPNNVNNWHCGGDILSKYKDKTCQYDDIILTSPFDLAVSKCKEHPAWGKYLMLYEIGANNTKTGRAIYFGHLKDFMVNNDFILQASTPIGIMGATGTMVYPKGYIHTHVELKNDRGNAVRTIGNLELWK